MPDSLILEYDGNRELIPRDSFEDTLKLASELFGLPENQIQFFLDTPGGACRVRSEGWSVLPAPSCDLFVQLASRRSLVKSASISTLLNDVSVSADLIGQPNSAPARACHFPIAAPLARRPSRSKLLDPDYDMASRMETVMPGQFQRDAPFPSPPLTPSASPIDTIVRRRSVRFEIPIEQPQKDDASTSSGETRSRRSSIDGNLTVLCHPPLSLSPERERTVRQRKRPNSNTMLGSVAKKPSTSLDFVIAQDRPQSPYPDSRWK